jgi:hypothetical protein
MSKVISWITASTRNKVIFGSSAAVLTVMVLAVGFGVGLTRPSENLSTVKRTKLDVISLFIHSRS